MKLKCLKCGGKDFTQVFEKPELITFFDAWEKSKEGEKIIDKYGNFIIKGGTDCSFDISILIAKTWKIIPAEPKVLNAAEVYDSNSHPILNNMEVEPEDFIKIWEVAEENGQLKQRLNHKEIREAADEIREYFKFSDAYEQPKLKFKTWSKLDDALKNLKSFDNNEK